MCERNVLPQEQVRVLFVTFVFLLYLTYVLAGNQQNFYTINWKIFILLKQKLRTYFYTLGLQKDLIFQ